MDAKELQELKVDVEMKIEYLLTSFNQVCCDNDFQAEEVRIETRNTDRDRRFSVDIFIT